MIVLIVVVIFLPSSLTMATSASARDSKGGSGALDGLFIIFFLKKR